MTNIIPFPGGTERIQREIERLLESSLDVTDPAVRDCIAKRVAAVLAKHTGIPTLSAQIDLPVGVRESDVQLVLAALQREYSEKVSAFAQGLIIEICLLEVSLCKLDHGLA